MHQELPGDKDERMTPEGPFIDIFIWGGERIQTATAGTSYRPPLSVGARRLIAGADRITKKSRANVTGNASRKFQISIAA